MGQKVSPIGLRVGVNRNWDSRWYANDQDFAGLLHEDIKIREYLLKKLKTASVAKVEIERSKNRVTIFVHTSRPGAVSYTHLDVYKRQGYPRLDGKTPWSFTVA